MKNWGIFLLICGAYVIDLIFDLVPDNEVRYSFFPLFHGFGDWNGTMTLQNYVYGYCQHVFLIIIFYAVHRQTGRKFWEFLMWIEFVDIVDYALHYNHTLFVIFGLDVDLNYFKFMAVLYLAHNEYAKRS